jgi:hypothetical protein
MWTQEDVTRLFYLAEEVLLEEELLLRCEGEKVGVDQENRKLSEHIGIR